MSLFPDFEHHLQISLGNYIPSSWVMFNWDIYQPLNCVSHASSPHGQFGCQQGATHEKHQRSKVVHNVNMSPFQRILTAQSRPDVQKHRQNGPALETLSIIAPSRIDACWFSMNIIQTTYINMSSQTKCGATPTATSWLPRWITFWLAQDPRPWIGTGSALGFHQLGPKWLVYDGKSHEKMDDN